MYDRFHWPLLPESCGCGSSPVPSPVPSPSVVDPFSSRVPTTSLWREPLCCEHRHVHLRGGFLQFCALSVLLSFSTPCLQTRNNVREKPMWSRFLGCGVICLIALFVFCFCGCCVLSVVSADVPWMLPFWPRVACLRGAGGVGASGAQVRARP